MTAAASSWPPGSPPSPRRFALAAGAGGGFVNNFTLPGTESQRALDLLKERFPQQSGDSSQIVFAVRDGRLTDAQRHAQVDGVVQQRRSACRT